MTPWILRLWSLAGAMALLQSPCSSRADDSPKLQKLARLMEAQGLQEMVDQQVTAGRAQAQQVVDQAMTQFRSELPEAPGDLLDRLGSAGRKFMAACEPSWTAEQAVDQWAQFYGAQLSEAEVDRILAFYLSEAGKKDVAASKAALPKWTSWMVEKQHDRFQQALTAYTNELNSMLAEARASRSKSSDVDP
jgi:hypothetical protein